MEGEAILRREKACKRVLVGFVFLHIKCNKKIEEHIRICFIKVTGLSAAFCLLRVSSQIS